MTIRVVLADDHAVVRKGIREFLEEDPDIEVVAEAGDGEKVKELILSIKPDVALLDVRMPYATGIDVARWIHDCALAVKVLILSAYDDDPFVIAALQAGAHGYVLKNAEADEITAAVHSVYRGQSVIAANLAQRAVAQLTGKTPAPTDALTEREREVLQLAAAGMTNRRIGTQLSISDRTMQGHLASIYTKFQVSSRTEAVTKGLQIGLIHLPESNP